MFPGLMRTACTPASIAFSARLALKWMSAITGISKNRRFATARRHPRSSEPRHARSRQSPRSPAPPSRDRACRRSEDRGCRRLSRDRALLAAPGDRRHPLQREPGAEGTRRRRAAVRINPGNIGGDDKVALVVEAAARRDPDADRRELGSLPKHLRSWRRPTRRRRSSRRRSRRSSCSNGSSSTTSRSRSSRARAGHDRAYRMLAEKCVPAAPRRHRGGHAVRRRDQDAVGIGALLPRHRRHDPVSLTAIRSRRSSRPGRS